jgi:hypothetical protein
MKRFIQGISRDQGTLFPEYLEDFVTEDNPVRVVDVFVEQLDLNQLGFKSVKPLAISHWTPRLSSCYSSQALHRRLPEPNTIQPPVRT